MPRHRWTTHLSGEESRCSRCGMLRRAVTLQGRYRPVRVMEYRDSANAAWWRGEDTRVPPCTEEGRR